MKTRELIARGAGLCGRMIRSEPRLFLVSLGGAGLVVLLSIGSAFAIGAVVADVVAPMLDRGRVDAGLLAGAAAFLGTCFRSGSDSGAAKGLQPISAC